jgi:hypothetical protein
MHCCFRSLSASLSQHGNGLFWFGHPIRKPEADIRVDLLLIWPALLILTLWSFWRTLQNLLLVGCEPAPHYAHRRGRT